MLNTKTLNAVKYEFLINGTSIKEIAKNTEKQIKFIHIMNAPDAPTIPDNNGYNYLVISSDNNLSDW